MKEQVTFQGYLLKRTYRTSTVRRESFVVSKKIDGIKECEIHIRFIS